MLASVGTTFLGHDLVATRHLRFWAERGLVHCEDARDNSYKSYSVRETLLRMKALSDMLGKSSQRDMHSEDQFDQARRAEIQTMLDGLLIVCNKAKEQGMPSDASARRDQVRRRPTTVVVPGLNSQM